jgi:hypothetical protein
MSCKGGDDTIPETTLATKLKLKAGQRAVVLNAPDGYLVSLQPLPEQVEVMRELAGSADWIQLFVKTKVELEQLLPQVLAALKPSSLLWITFPKGTSKIQTDLTRDVGWDALQQADLKWVNLISVNPTWSAFCLRPYKRGEARRSFR